MACIKIVTNGQRNFLNAIEACNGLNLQFVRYRKPRFVPKAPTKIFKVREPTPRDTEETKLMRTWQAHYNTEMKSLHLYFKSHCQRIRERERIEAIKTPFEKRYVDICRKNEEWNKEAKMIRLGQWKEKEKWLEDRHLAVAEREEREREETREMAFQRVREAQESLDNYITEENLDEKLDEILGKEVDYDFALYLDGSKTTVPDSKTEDNPGSGSSPS
ncbi:probable 28S ribosomal protein S26, mitochondrial [Mya arenaria]|uniref:probable 28S ribosomal protein S26, mitochondrial n=1 Tax=Mya arenaria TaxID=6604 RepID=UPI0022E4AC05|nr:probable 28S ribosomal protein S26, mitochondrial [Mya arenaria]